MKLTNVQITNFQSVQDSNEFEIDDVTCLVGKNEAGKTALLKALYRLNPINKTDEKFNVTDDYPRQTVADYENNVETRKQQPAIVGKATFKIDPKYIKKAKESYEFEFSEDQTLTVTLSKGYSNKPIYSFNSKDSEGRLTEVKFGDSKSSERYFIKQIPKFLYFDEYYQMKGQENIEQLMQRVTNKKLEDPDYPLLGLIQLAGLDLARIIDTKHTEHLIAKLEGAGNSLTQKVLPYWSQNQHLRMKFDIRPGQTGDPNGLTSGTNIWSRVEDTKHNVTTSLGTRSRGFVWFFSFLAWYSNLSKDHENLILLLDEPGLFLHAKAQGDLLNYFEKELIPNHQIIYTTHSPFMVDPMHFDRVRIVQDLSIEANTDTLPDDKQGTKVITEVMEAIPDSLFPLQGALGYEISQTLFIGPNSLVVEGVSDLLYIQTISTLLQEKGKRGLNSDWTITPVGGSGNIFTFVSLLGSQSNLNIAVLIDLQKNDRQKIENLYKTKLLKQNQVFTYADFVEDNEADIEDMFEIDFYFKLVNKAFNLSIKREDIPEGSPRIIRCLESYFKNEPIPNGVKFNHYRPALYFSNNIKSLEEELTEFSLDRFQKAFDALNKLLAK